jgi:hypothetical protein
MPPNVLLSENGATAAQDTKSTMLVTLREYLISDTIPLSLLFHA